MKTESILALLGTLCALWLPGRAVAGGTWAPLSNSPGYAGHFLLLSDGTVMAEDLSTNYGPRWFRLTPDIHGSYANGTWSTIAPMNYTRLDFSSDVLTNGKVFVAGGEYGAGGATSEIYDPVSNLWTVVPVPNGLLYTGSSGDGGNSGFRDSGSVLLANGRVLVAPVFPNNLDQTLIYDPAANAWSGGPASLHPQVEGSWVKLPDDSILTVDTGATTSERYLPSLNTWVADANAPVRLYDTYGTEEGPALLLPNGKAIFFSATNQTAIYTPSGTTNLGSWVAGPNFPNAQGMPDAPAAMLVNGKILCVTEHVATNGTEWYPPLSFYEYDYLANSFTRVGAPGGGTTFNDACWPTLLLDLPDGTVLFGHRNTDFYVYEPDGVPLAAGQPVINSISTNSDGSLHLTGTLFNGLCQGAAYGDDEQMDSNFPLVRFTDANGHVRYGRTYGWSRTSVMTGNAIVTTECTVPAGVSLSNTVQVVANGIASAGVPMNFPAIYAVINAADSGAGSLRQAIAGAISGDVINFAPYLSGSTIMLTSGEMQLTGNLTIDASALTNGIRLDGSFASRIFNIAAGANVVLNSLTLTNGHLTASELGGALINSGTLALTNCTLAGNFVDGEGNGGAIENVGTLTLTGCTLAGNGAGYAGAMRNEATCTLQNCTFYANTAPDNGGAIDNVFGATLNVLHCTFSYNSAGYSGSGIDNYLSQVNLTNSIIALNGGQDIYNWSGSTVSVGGSNIVQTLVNGGGTVNGSAFAADPQLAPLGNFGGPTQTMPPLPGSPAIDSAIPVGLATDQRGFPRPLGLAPDIGAVEGVFNSAGPGELTSVTRSGNGSLKFAFTNYTDTSYTVLATTNVALPLGLWWNLGAALEMPVGSGQFRFTDPQATNNARRFYRVRSP